MDDANSMEADLEADSESDADSEEESVQESDSDADSELDSDSESDAEADSDAESDSEEASLAQREPLLSNIQKPNTDPGYPINYFVPNFGVDTDIIATQDHLKQ